MGVPFILQSTLCYSPIGRPIFAAGPGEVLGKRLYVQKHRISSGRQTVTVTIRERPARAGIYPYYLLDWEEGTNIDPVTIETAIAKESS